MFKKDIYIIILSYSTLVTFFKYSNWLANSNISYLV